MATEPAPDLSLISRATIPRALPEPTQRPAGFLVRLFAYAVDLITCLLVLFPVLIGFALAGWPVNSWPAPARIALEFSTVFLVMILPSYFQGGSPGKLLFDLRVIDNRLGLRPPLIQLVFRETIARLISVVFLFAGFFNALLNRDRETWHDLLARTRVVQIEDKSASEDLW